MFYFKFEKSRERSIGWGTWIRTKILGVRVRCSTVELSPSRAGRDGGRNDPPPLCRRPLTWGNSAALTSPPPLSRRQAGSGRPARQRRHRHDGDQAERRHQQEHQARAAVVHDGAENQRRNNAADIEAGGDEA